MVELITICLNDPAISKELSMKNLALITWSSARIKMPRECELPIKLELKAKFTLNNCIKSSFLYDWNKKALENNKALSEF